MVEERDDMDRVKMSSKFQIVIPKRVRERMYLTPGREMGVIEKGVLGIHFITSVSGK